MHLSEYMAEQGLTDEEVADRIGKSRATVSRIRRRKMRPGWEVIAELRRISRGKITADDFQCLDGEAA